MSKHGQGRCNSKPGSSPRPTCMDHVLVHSKQATSLSTGQCITQQPHQEPQTQPMQPAPAQVAHDSMHQLDLELCWATEQACLLLLQPQLATQGLCLRINSLISVISSFTQQAVPHRPNVVQCMASSQPCGFVGLAAPFRSHVPPMSMGTGGIHGSRSAAAGPAVLSTGNRLYT